jgi:hypothetical protein
MSLSQLAFSFAAWRAQQGITNDVGCGILAVANGVFALASHPVLLIVEALLWGLHMGCTEGVSSPPGSPIAP